MDDYRNAAILAAPDKMLAFEFQRATYVFTSIHITRPTPHDKAGRRGARQPPILQRADEKFRGADGILRQ